MRRLSMRVVVSLVCVIFAGCSYDDSQTYPYPTTPPVVNPPQAEFTNGLWTVSGSPSHILGLGESQLLADGTQTPATTLFTSSASLFTLNSVAFDSAGTLWVASRDDSALYGFAADPAARNGFR